MSQQSPVAVATQRLLGKQQNVEEQIHALEGHMDALIALEGELEARLQLALSQVDLRLSALMQAVEHKKNQLVLSLKEAVAREKSVCEDYRTKALEIVDKAKKVTFQVFCTIFYQPGVRFMRAWLVLRLLYVSHVCVCVCVRPQLSHALSYVIRYYATIATSTVEATGSLQPQ